MPTTMQIKMVGRAPTKPSGEEQSASVEITRMLVTPRQAAEWLKANTANRRIMPTQVNRYSRDMQAGKWQFTGDPIRFDAQGMLVDGQHRLLACIDSGASFEATVVRGLALEARDAIDIGRSRSVGNILELRGYKKNTSWVAAAIRALLDIKQGEGRRTRPTVAEQLEVLDRHPQLIDSVELMSDVRGLSRGLCAALHYVAKRLLNDEATAEAFIDVFKTGVPTYQGDPAHAFRETQLRNAGRRTPHEVFFGAIRAFNGLRQREIVDRFMTPRNPQTIKGLNRDLI